MYFPNNKLPVLLQREMYKSWLEKGARPLQNKKKKKKEMLPSRNTGVYDKGNSSQDEL